MKSRPRLLWKTFYRSFRTAMRHEQPKADNPGCVECGGYALMFIDGTTLLCWDHYCEAMLERRDENMRPRT